jgi:hypothetical protein
MIRLWLCVVLVSVAWCQSPAIPRQANGRPDLQGVWRSAIITPAFDVQTRPTAGTPAVIVDPPDGKLPYLPEAAKRAQENTEARYRDPVGYCHPHGVPRSVYPPFPMEIVQDADYLAILSETEHSLRVIPLDGRPHRKNYWSYSGDSRGRWEGDTLVVDVTGFNGKNWLDQAGNFVSENEHAVERFTMTDADTIMYEATVTDPAVYSRPWTVRLPLRRQPKGTELIEYDCVEGERDFIHFQNLEKQQAK